MPIELWYGKQFEQVHEREALVKFWKRLTEVSNGGNQLRMLAIESSINTASIDMLLIQPHAVVIVELKSLSPHSPIPHPQRIALSGRENGPWTYSADGRISTLGGKQNDRNPFDQARTYRAKVARWLQDYFPNISSEPIRNPSDILTAWVAISPSFDNDTSKLDLPWDSISKWFDVVPLDKLADKFIRINDSNLNVTPQQMRSIVNKLGLRQCRDIEEVIPEIPPIPRIFSSPSRAPQVIDREHQLAQLQEYIKDPEIAVINLGGQSGIGKTTLAAWAVKQWSDPERVYWIDCASQKSLTGQMLLSAIAEDAPLDRQLAIRGFRGATFTPNEYALTELERIDMALELLSQPPSLLVFDDYHAIAQQPGIAAFIKYVLNRQGNLHVILTTQSHPYRDDWSRQAYRDIYLDKLPPEAFSQFVQQLAPDKSLAAKQLEIFYHRVSGNPGVAQICSSMFEQYRRIDAVEQMPVFSERDVKAWLSANMDGLSRKAKEFAQILSALGPGEKLAVPLIRRVWQGPAVEAMKLIDEMVEKYMARSIGQDSYILDELAADFLYSQMELSQRDDSHRLIGRQLLALAEATSNEWGKADLQAKAIHHLSIGGPRKMIVPIALKVHDTLSKAGDWDRATLVLQSAADAATALKNMERQCAFTLQLAEDQLFIGEDLTAVAQSLRQVEQLLQASSAQAISSPDNPWSELRARFWLLSGLLHYRRPDYAQASSDLQKALDAALHLQNQALTVRSALQLGLVERRRQNWDRADEAFQAALGIAQAQADIDLEIECTRNLGTDARKRGDFVTARHHYSTALELARKTDDALAREMALSGLGRLEDELGHPDQGIPLLEEALKIAREKHNTRGVRIELTRLINVLIALRQIETATELLEESETLNSKADDYIGLAWNKKHRGQLQQLAGDVADGNRLIHEGNKLLVSLGIQEHSDEFFAAIQQPSGD